MIHIHVSFHMLDYDTDPCQFSHARLYHISAHQASHTILFKMCLHVRFHMVAVALEFHTAKCGCESYRLNETVRTCTVLYLTCKALSKNGVGKHNSEILDTTANLQLDCKRCE
jgi:hypothetical protein